MTDQIPAPEFVGEVPDGYTLEAVPVAVGPEGALPEGSHVYIVTGEGTGNPTVSPVFESHDKAWQSGLDFLHFVTTGEARATRGIGEDAAKVTVRTPPTDAEVAAFDAKVAGG